MSEVVKLERHDEIGIVTVDSPPVNALSAAVRGGILTCIKAAIADPAIKGIVLTCAGRTFIAGADITEFGKPPKPPGLNEVLAEMENSPKPIVAAIHGTALGGGLEVALACHFRVAVKEAKLGLPEVKLGLLPGAGGTQRLPRAVGPELAVKMIVGGDPDRRGRSAEARPDRGDRRRPGLRRRSLRPQAARREASAAPSARRRFQDRGGQGRPLDLHQCGRRDDQEVARPGSAVRGGRRRRLRHRPAVRRGPEEGARGLPQARRQRPVQGAALCLLRRARGQQDRGRARGHQVAAGEPRRHSRRRHHGRRHRDVVCQCRRSRHPDRDRRGAAQARHGHHAEELGSDRRARRHPGGCARQAHGADQRRRRHRECR